MGVPAYVQGFKSFGYKTANAGTAIGVAIPPVTGFRTALLRLVYLAAATAHTISLMFPASENNGSTAPASATLSGSKNTCDGGAAAGQAIINVDNAPKDPAGNATADGDIIAYECSDGTWEFNVVDSLSTKAITCKSNLVKAIADGGKVRILGVAGDLSCFQLTAGASATTDYDGEPVLACPDIGEPAYLSINNATNAGFLLNALFAYLNK